MVVAAMLAFAPLQLALAAAVATPAGLPYPIATMGYTTSINGRDIQLNGTIQEIHSQLRTLYPDFDLESSATAARDIVSDALEPRGKVNRHCLPVGNWGWSGAYSFAIKQGIDYLNGRPDQQGDCYAIGHSCVTISCSYNSGIYLCNDNAYPIHPSCGYLGSYAQDLINGCTYFDRATNAEMVGGQEFDTDGYNVIVHSDRC